MVRCDRKRTRVLMRLEERKRIPETCTKRKTNYPKMGYGSCKWESFTDSRNSEVSLIYGKEGVHRK